MKYHARIPAVAWDIQENVKNEVQSMTGLPVRAVNIHAQGVEIPDKDLNLYRKEQKQMTRNEAREHMMQIMYEMECMTENDERGKS